MAMEERRELQRGLKQLDGAIFFILLLIVSILFSLWSMGQQRRALLAALRGEDPGDSSSSVLSLKRASSALVIGSLGFFLCLSLDALRRARAGIAKHSAQVNALASTLVLGAALLRFYDLLLEESGALNAMELAQADDLPPV